MTEEPSITRQIERQIKDNPVLIYMKGSPHFPQCGFSAKAVQILAECKVKFSYVDILKNQDIRSTLPKVSNWPTFPQLYISGELMGGSDIMTEMHASGELKEKLEQATAAEKSEEAAPSN